jgi:copper chaperone CopZ
MMSISKYAVSGMTCGGCVGRVKATLSEYAESVEVSLQPPQALLNNPRIALDALNDALSKVGNYALSETEAAQLASVNKTNDIVDNPSWLATYKPLLLIFAYILLVALAVEYTQGDFELHRFMPNFMAGFFLVFSFFKLLNLQGFADSYAMYDLLAMRFKPYGYLYAFIELGLGISYLLAWQPTLTNWLTLIVMAFSSLGVIRAVANKQKIRCACLGAVFNLPMSTVTIIEDLLMAGMALWMLVL